MVFLFIIFICYEKTYHEKQANKNFIGTSFTSFEQLCLFRNEKSITRKELPFEEREFLTEAIHENNIFNRRIDPLVNGIPLSNIIKSNDLLETTKSLRETPVHDYGVILSQVGRHIRNIILLALNTNYVSLCNCE